MLWNLEVHTSPISLSLSLSSYCLAFPTHFPSSSHLCPFLRLTWGTSPCLNAARGQQGLQNDSPTRGQSSHGLVNSPTANFCKSHLWLFTANFGSHLIWGTMTDRYASKPNFPSKISASWLVHELSSLQVVSSVIVFRKSAVKSLQ